MPDFSIFWAPILHLGLKFDAGFAIQDKEVRQQPTITLR